jgi:hypothetical protein
LTWARGCTGGRRAAEANEGSARAQLIAITTETHRTPVLDMT